MDEFRDFYLSVMRGAMSLGYTQEHVRVFMGDIEDHYNNGLSVEQVLEIEF